MSAVVAAFAVTTHGKEGTGCMKSTHSIHSTAEAVDSLTKKWIAFYGDPANSARLNAFTTNSTGRSVGGFQVTSSGASFEGRKTKFDNKRSNSSPPNTFTGTASFSSRPKLPLKRVFRANFIARSEQRFGSQCVAQRGKSATSIGVHILYDEIPESHYLPLVNVDLACLPSTAVWICCDLQ